MDENLKYLKKQLDFWDKLSVEQQGLLNNNTVMLSYSKGETIYSPERECVGVLIIKSGEIRTYILSEEGKEVTLFRSSVGDICILSASCILQNITFDVFIEAVENTEVLLINSMTFSQLISQNIHVELFSLKITADRFSDVMWAMEQILFLSFDARLAVFLIDESAKKGSLILNLTHEQIAKYIGSAREVVTRMLKYFSREGIVELKRGSIIILNKEKLKVIASTKQK